MIPMDWAEIKAIIIIDNHWDGKSQKRLCTEMDMHNTDPQYTCTIPYGLYPKMDYPWKLTVHVPNEYYLMFQVASLYLNYVKLPLMLISQSP